MTIENNQDLKRKFGFAKIRKSRLQGATNKTTRSIQDAAILAAEAVAENDRGTNDLVGYLKRLAGEEPKIFVSLLGKILRLQHSEERSRQLARPGR